MADIRDPRQPIPAGTQRFILANIKSVAEVEALLLLRSTPEQAWSAPALAQRLYIDPLQTADILKQLAERQFLVGDSGGEATYRYQPGSAELRDGIDRLAQVYATHLIAVTELIHSKSKSRVQEFANAFRIRKDD
jgi:hypothetical protein